VLPACPPRLGDHGVALAPGLVEELELVGGLFGVGGVVDGPQVSGDGFALGVADVAHARADHVHDACLYPCLGEHGADGVGEPGEPVDAGDQYVTDATVV